MANDDQDSDELEALFDEVSAKSAPAPVVKSAPAPVVKSAPQPAGKAPAKPAAQAQAGRDNPELESLFDSIVAGVSAEESGRHEAHAAAPDEVFNRIGHMTRELHDALRQLGLDKHLEQAASTIPDARERLMYVAKMTEQAALRVLNATDAAGPIVDKLERDAAGLGAEWQKLFDNQLSVDQFKDLAARTKSYLQAVPGQSGALKAGIMEIVMAQDFQDLTGQVIKKIMEVTQQMEKELVTLLIENAPESARQDGGLLNGPVINAEGRSDVVTGQDQVDELLESLGF